MRILLVSFGFPLSEEEMGYSFVFNEARRLVEEGVEVHVARANSCGDKIVDGIHVHGPYVRGESAFLSLITRYGWKIPFRYPISWYSHRRLIKETLILARSIAELVEGYEIDIIHAHFAYSEGFIAYLAKEMVKRPLVISVWGYDIQSAKKYGYGVLSQKYTYDAVRKALKNADTIIVGAGSHYRTVKELLGKEGEKKVFFIPVALEIDRFNPSLDGSKIRKKHEIGSDKTVVLFGRHLRPIYGAQYLIEAAAKVVKEHPKTIFVLAGEGPLRQSLEDSVQKKKLERNVIFVGLVPRMKMPFYFAACDIFCDPCIFGQGVSSLEALACGKPVIGFNTGQIKIRNGEHGFLVEPRNVSELADKISVLIENPSLREEMGMKGRRMVEKEHNFERRIHSLIEIYEKLIAI